MFEGYKRNEEIQAQLVSALAHALARHPEQRLGQLLENVSYGHAMWLMWDEEWIEKLNAF